MPDGMNIAEIYSTHSWTGTTITYTFSSGLPIYYTPDDYEGGTSRVFESLNATQQAAINALLATLEDVTNINFVEIAQSSQSIGDIALV